MCVWLCFEKVKKESDINYCLKALTCKHQFHRRCIIPWIRTNDTCPVCRKKKRTGRSSEYMEEEELFTIAQTLADRLGFGSSGYYTRDELIDIIRGRRSGRTVRSNYVIHSETQL